MVATAVARLAGAGRVALDDPVAAHVPELAGTEWAARATLRDLLANTSRVPLRAGFEFGEFPGDDDGVLGRFVAEAATGGPAAPMWSYSNVGWAVVGRVLETVTGRVWEQAMTEELLEPLELTETTFVAAGDIPCAAGHGVTADGVVRSTPWTPRALGPAGATLLSTVGDMLRFAEAHLRPTSFTVLRDAAAEVRIHGWFDAWCHGWARFDWEGGPVWGWDGLITGQRSVLRLVPERGAAVLLMNGATGRLLYRSLLPDVMQSSFGIRMPALDLEPTAGAAGDLLRFEGGYAWPDREWHVTAHGDVLVFTTGGNTFEGLPIDERTFVVDASDPDTPTVTFANFDRDCRPGVLYEMLWGFPRRRRDGHR
jgi:CubicO group peptidase (beta-lactamase class C family)